VVSLFLAHAFYLEGVAEDAFISFRFASNLVEGHGFVWNPGAAPVEGYTNFLWVLCSAVWILLGVDPGFGAQLLGVGASLVTLFLLWRAGVRALGWSEQVALLPCLFLALAGPFAAWSVGGLETNLFGMFLLWGALRFALYWGDRRPGHLYGAYSLLLLAALTRPEGVLAIGVLAAVGLALARGDARARRALYAPLLLTGVGFAVFLAWRWGTFGSLLPNTYYAKTGDAGAQLARGAEYVGYFGLHYLVPWLPALALGWRGIPERVRGQPLLLCSGALTASFALAVVWEGGDYMAMYRFLVPLLPFVYLLLVAALQPALRIQAGAPRRGLAAVAFGCAALGTLFHSTPLEALLLPKPPRLHGNWRGVQTERWHVARLGEIGRFFGREGRPGESLATDAIGVVGWSSGLTVYGAHGLVDPVLARRAGRGVGAGVAGHERLDFAYLLGRRPTFLMFRRELRREKLRGLELAPEMAELAAEYRLRAVWLEDPANGEVGWFSYLERRDRAEASGE
jgi:hypothetical protein